jgi:dethiobiotin synthetase
MPVHVFITGTDTGVGKTVISTWLVEHLTATGRVVAAFKPLCSGGRTDAHALRAAAGNRLPLDVVNPWHFWPEVTPLLAARLERRTVSVANVVRHIRTHGAGADVVVVEGAGGLLSPLLIDGDAPELIRALRARIVVVAANRLGAIHQCRAVHAALPAAARRGAQFVLVEQARPDSSAATNPAMVDEYLGYRRVHRAPWLPARRRPARDAAAARAHLIEALVRALEIPPVSS